MAVGPGVYDQAATTARTSTGAAAVILIVIGGEHGGGFSVQSVAPLSARVLAEILRTVATAIEADGHAAS